jgi:hypothetical protein
MKTVSRLPLVALLLGVATGLLAAEKAVPVPPEWALPGTATHQQVPPPAGFTRASTIITEPIGIFEGQAEVGTSLVPGSASFDAATGRYTIDSAGYNIWYFRDEFRFLWKKLSGDVSFAADITFPNPQGYDDRKVVLIVRQDLDDNAQEIMAGLHGAGLIHLAQRPTKGADLAEVCRDKGTGPVGATKPVRLGIEKHGDAFTLFVGQPDGSMKPVGQPFTLKFDAPFYVGIGFTSHLPVTSDTGVVGKVVLENAAGKVK